ncbi:MAG TPA: MBL fold metallo-hydrolase [Spirochaetota bacterium]|nr:MBL fold metallo-hydrolase [Spirochaetota bacterium]
MSDKSDLRLKVWGCRGSIAARNKIPEFYNSVKDLETKSNIFSTGFGINTTCFSVESRFLPANTILFIDTGSGFFTASPYYFSKGYKKLILMQTHYHYDHTIGLTMSLYMHIPDPDIDISLYGPQDQTIGAKKAISHLMHKPVFPIEISERVERFKQMVQINEPRNFIMLIHPRFGVKKIRKPQYNEISGDKKRFKINKNSESVYLSDCMVIKCNDCVNHPQKTLSYRIEAGNKSLVILTDHENTDGIHVELKPHLQDSDVLIMDSQFTKKGTPAFIPGLGHGTPDYCVKVAKEVKARRLFLTHHAPNADDQQIKAIEAEARGYAGKELEITSLREGLSIEV